MEERKLVRVAKEAGLTTSEVIEGVANGELITESGSRDAVNVDVEGSGKGHVR